MLARKEARFRRANYVLFVILAGIAIGITALVSRESLIYVSIGVAVLLALGEYYLCTGSENVCDMLAVLIGVFAGCALLLGFCWAGPAPFTVSLVLLLYVSAMLAYANYFMPRIRKILRQRWAKAILASGEPSLTDSAIRDIFFALKSKGYGSEWVYEEATAQLDAIAETRKIFHDVSAINERNPELHKLAQLIDDIARGIYKNLRAVASLCLVSDRNDQVGADIKRLLDQNNNFIAEVNTAFYDAIHCSVVERESGDNDIVDEIRRLRELTGQILTGARGDRPVLLSDINSNS